MNATRVVKPPGTAAAAPTCCAASARTARRRPPRRRHAGRASASSRAPLPGSVPARPPNGARVAHRTSAECAPGSRRARAYRGSDMPSMSPRIRRPSAPMVVALLALFVALGGPAQAAKLINGAEIKKGTVGSKQIDGPVARSCATSARAPSRAHRDARPARSPARARATTRSTTRALAPGQRADRQRGRQQPHRRGPRDQLGRRRRDRRQRGRAVGDPRRTASAASEIADGSIDGREIVDGGLSVRDVARQVGTLQLAGRPARRRRVRRRRSVPVAGIQIAGDFLLISPTTAWPTSSSTP